MLSEAATGRGSGKSFPALTPALTVGAAGMEGEGGGGRDENALLAAPTSRAWLSLESPPSTSTTRFRSRCSC